MNDSSAKKSPLKFFLLVYALSAPLWLIELFIEVKGLPLEIPITDILAAFTPSVAACLLVYREKGKDGVKELLKRIFDFSRIKQNRWRAVIVFLPVALFAAIYAAMRLLNLPLAAEPKISFLSIPFLFVFFFFGAAGEEVGYTGYATDPLQEQRGALAAGLIIGLPWAIWHYPSIIQQGHSVVWILWGTLGTVAFRILTIWLYNNTGKSLFACILFHALYNTGRPLFPRDAIHNPLVDYPEVHYSVIALAAVAVTLWGSKTLTGDNRHK